MHNRIDNQNALDIIKYWFKKCALEKEYFNKFICLWISFNCFFVAKFFEEASKISKSNEPNEGDYLNIVKKITKTLCVTVYRLTDCKTNPSLREIIFVS